MPARGHLRRFVGVDLGGGRGKNTAVARLELGDDVAGAPILRVAEAKIRYGQRGTGAGQDEPGGDTHFRDDVLVAYLQRWVDEDTVVAVNAPLSLPPCIRCDLPCPGTESCVVPQVMWMRDWAPRLKARGRSDRGKPVITPYTQRAVELLVQATGVAPREALGQGTGPLAARAAHLRRRLSPLLRMHENFLEVHPQATVQRLFGAAAARRAHHGDQVAVWDQRKAILANLAENLAFDYVWPELVVRNLHVFQAVICGFTAYLWARERWQGPADLVAAAVGADPNEPRAVVGEAAATLGWQWLEDGWIWIPPAKPGGRA